MSGMKKKFSGQALFLDRDDINTDEIIPAKYLTENSKIDLKTFVLEDLKIDGFDPKRDIEAAGVIITRNNFGCGSSREHAVWVFEVNDINVVIGEGFARIFRQNMFNCGMLAIELLKEHIDYIISLGSDIYIDIDLKNQIVSVSDNSQENPSISEYKFNLNEFDKELIEAGGWLAYANDKY